MKLTGKMSKRKGTVDKRGRMGRVEATKLVVEETVQG